MSPRKYVQKRWAVINAHTVVYIYIKVKIALERIMRHAVFTTYSVPEGNTGFPVPRTMHDLRQDISYGLWALSLASRQVCVCLYCVYLNN